MHYVSETSSSINMDIVFWCVLTHTHLSLLNLQPTPTPPHIPHLQHALLLQGEEVWFELELIGTLFD